MQSGLLFPRLATTKHAHGLLTARLLGELLSAGPSKGENGSRKLPPWPVIPGDWARRVARSVAGHHGTFPRADLVGRLTSRDLGGGLWEDVRSRLLARLAEFTGVTESSTPSFPGQDANGLLMLLAGLTSVADWIGSDERYFPPAGEAVDLRRYLREAPEKAKNALDALGWTGWRGKAEVGDFRQVFPELPPRPVQVRTCELAREIDGPALVIIEAPTGEGKTEAAFYLGAAWNARLRQGGCYVALPTQATSNQMYERTRCFLSKLYPEDKVNLHLLHSGAALADLGWALQPRNVSPDGEQDETPNVVAEEWFKRAKRGLLAPFAVGTVDQVLLAVLQTRHVFVRLFGLANKTIIIDEVHAYDTYMSTLLERLLEWLRSLGCSVVLLSATLPRAKRERLLQAYAGAEVATAEKPYPRITWAVPGASEAIHVKADPSLSRTVHIEWFPNEPGELAPALWEALKEGGCCACVCNTVARAQALYEALRGYFQEEELILFHSRFPWARRQALEKEVLDRFGKEGSRRPGRAVLVATQVIEQSLDVDFDLMVTDFAPVDLVIQRVGRLHRHRHRRGRPEPFRVPRLWLLTPDLDESGVPVFGKVAPVYDEYVLLRSYLALSGLDKLRLPDEVEPLIEAVYGNQEPSCPNDEWQEALRRAERRLREQIRREQFCARSNLIRSPTVPADVLDDLDDPCKSLEEENPEVHRSLQALTRLGNPSVQVVCLHRVGRRVCLEADGAETVHLDRQPTAEETRDLLRRSLSISHQGLYQRLQEMPVPKGWQRNALLRHHRPLIFEEGRVQVGNYDLRLDPTLGLVIEKGE